MSDGVNSEISVGAHELVIPTQSQELPILQYAEEIKELVSESDTTIIVGETGSGKTTQLPHLLREILPPDSRIAITQPRRIAATEVARYVASQIDQPLGEEVGYKIRFDNNTTEGTKLNFMTDGILLREMLQDPLLKNYGAVMVDEVHERSLNIDFILGLLKRTQKERGSQGLSPLKIVVASATLEKEKLSDFFEGAATIEVPGRLHPVETEYMSEDQYNSYRTIDNYGNSGFDYVRAAVDKTLDVLPESVDGNILIFMPGTREINDTIEGLRKQGQGDYEVLPLHGQLSSEEQERIFRPSDKRKVIVSTNIAETSVTPPGVVAVIDSGKIRQKEFNPSTGIEALVTEDHAKSGCKQRSGRAGRLMPGTSYRLFTQDNFERRREFQLPEIKRSNLAHVVLMMKKMGIDDISSFEFIDPPTQSAINKAFTTLEHLGAIGEDEQLTEVGHRMAELPLRPELSRMIIEAQKYGCVEDVATLAGFFGNKSVFVRPQGNEEEASYIHYQFSDVDSDFITLLNVWKEYERRNYDRRWARDNFLNIGVLREVGEVKAQLRDILEESGVSFEGNESEDGIAKAVTAGFIENLLQNSGFSFSSGYHQVIKSDNNADILIHPSSALTRRRPTFIVAADIVETSRKFARTCQVVTPELIHEVAPQMVNAEDRGYYYSPLEDKVYKTVDYTFKGGVVPFGSERQLVTGVDAVRGFADALMSGVVRNETVSENARQAAFYDELAWRAGGMRTSSGGSLEDFYIEKLGTICSKKELNEALASGELDLSLPEGFFMSEDEVREIQRNNPSTLRVGDENLSLRYSGDRVSLSLSPFDLERMTVMPQLPSGRDVTLEVSLDGRFFEGTNLASIKQQVRAYQARLEGKTRGADVADQISDLVTYQEKESEMLLEKLRDLTDRRSKWNEDEILELSIVLASRSPSEFESLQLTEEDYRSIMKNMKSMINFARGRDDTELTREQLEDMRATARANKAAVEASRQEIVREYLGDDDNDRHAFQDRFVEFFKERGGQVPEGEMPSFIEQVLEKMTE
ncbi:MAG: DEAD/DEAH box helicase [Candidatus Levybacteria bacterium]|nr:DEAD/DEAH box helicase [Candidatus Levybacteria bacterium]